MDAEETWTDLPKYSEQYITGVKAFLLNAFPKFAVGDEMTCPCKKCKNIKWQSHDLIYDHLICNGPCPKDQNPVVSNVNYYGAIEEILEVDYWGVYSVVLFKCCWYQEEKDLYGLTRVNFNKLWHKSDPYVVASQVQQVFYVEDPTEKILYNVIRKMPRDWCDVESEIADDDKDDTNLHKEISLAEIEHEFNDASWCRDDVPPRQVPL